MTERDPIVIVGSARTPMGGFQGDFAGVPAATLGATAIEASLSRAGLAKDAVQEILMGCVLSAGQGQAPARQAAIAAGLPLSAGATTLNKMCGSGMKAVMLAHDLIHAGSSDVVVAGGMESMSNAPYLLPKARTGHRMGHGQVLDHMFLDGLEDAYEKGRLMGTFAEDCAEAYQFTRDAQDAYALASLERARRATTEGRFVSEIAPVLVSAGKTETRVSIDEQPGKAQPEKIPKLRPAFREGGTVTAANASSISDGAAALVLMRASEAERRGLAPRARIVGHASYANEPSLFATAPSARCVGSRSGRVGRCPMSICLRSTRHSRWSPWPPCATSICRMIRSTSMGRLRARPSHRRLGCAGYRHASCSTGG